MDLFWPRVLLGDHRLWLAKCKGRSSVFLIAVLSGGVIEAAYVHQVINQEPRLQCTALERAIGGLHERSW